MSAVIVTRYGEVEVFVNHQDSCSGELSPVVLFENYHLSLKELIELFASFTQEEWREGCLTNYLSAFQAKRVGVRTTSIAFYWKPTDHENCFQIGRHIFARHAFGELLGYLSWHACDSSAKGIQDLCPRIQEKLVILVEWALDKETPPMLM